MSDESGDVANRPRRDERCPDCGESIVGGWLCGCSHKNNGSTNQETGGRSSSPAVPVDRDLIDRCVKAAHERLARTPGLPADGDVSRLTKPMVELPRPIIEAVVPLVEQATLARVREQIEGLRLNAPGRLPYVFNEALDAVLGLPSLAAEDGDGPC